MGKKEKRGRPKKYTDEYLLYIFRESGGNLYRCAKEFEVPQHTIYNRLRSATGGRLREELDRCREAQVAYAQATVMAASQDYEKNPKVALDAAKYTLSRRARDMGWTRKDIPDEGAKEDFQPSITFTPKQNLALFSDATVTGWGGSVGGGKSFMLSHIGAFVRDSRFALIRKVRDDLQGVRDLLVSTKTGKLTGNRFTFHTGSTVDLGYFGSGSRGLQRLQGQSYDGLLIDEAAYCPENLFRTLMTWTRSAEKKSVRVILCSNPPLPDDLDEDHIPLSWMRDYFAPWLDEAHPLYGTVKEGETLWARREFDEWGDSYEDFRREEFDGAMSRTFIRSRLSDNPHLDSEEYRTRLKNTLPPDYLPILLDGVWDHALAATSSSVIPKDWLSNATDRKPPSVPGRLVALGVDPSDGGRDRTAIAALMEAGPYRWILPIGRRFSGDGHAVVAFILDTVSQLAITNNKYSSGDEKIRVVVDATGIGASTRDLLAEDPRFNVVPFQGAARPTRRTVGFGSQSRRLSNARAEGFYILREACDPALGESALILPDDARLIEELAASRWAVSSTIAVERKENIRKRIKRSPDSADAVSMALWRAAGVGVVEGAAAF